MEIKKFLPCAVKIIESTNHSLLFSSVVVAA